MNRLLNLFLMVFVLFALAACGGDDDAATSGGGDTAADGAGASDEQDDHAHGEKTDLGSKAAGPANVSLVLYGPVTAGFEAAMDIVVTDMQPEAVRVWIGVESAKGSMKSKLDPDEGTYHGHVDVPTKLPEGSAVWIELEAPDGKRHRVSFAFDAS